jgi:hypothetical protein
VSVVIVAVVARKKIALVNAVKRNAMDVVKKYI